MADVVDGELIGELELDEDVVDEPAALSVDDPQAARPRGRARAIATMEPRENLVMMKLLVGRERENRSDTMDSVRWMDRIGPASTSSVTR
jgi:hypothetical protein